MLTVSQALSYSESAGCTGSEFFPEPLSVLGEQIAVSIIVMIMGKEAHV